MKDNKFKIMLILAAAWLGLFILSMFKEVNPRVEIIALLACVGWFAYWTFSYLRTFVSKSDKERGQSEQTEKTDDHCHGSCGCSSHKPKNAGKNLKSKE